MGLIRWQWFQWNESISHYTAVIMGFLTHFKIWLGILSLKVSISMNCGSTHVMSGKQSSGQWLSMWWMVLGSACGSFTRDWFRNPSWVGSFQLCRFLLCSAAVATVVDADLWDGLRTALTNGERIHSDAKICLKVLYSRELHFWIWFLKHLQ